MIDVFKVGVSMTFAGNGAEFLGILLRDLGKVHVATEKLKTQFGALRTAAIGFGAVVVGGIALKGLFDLTKQAEKLNHELVKIKTGAGLNDTQVADTGSLAWRMTKEVPGTTVAGNVAAQRELFGVFGQMPEVQEVLKQVLQGNQAVSNFTDDPTDLAKVAVRALEIRGQIGKDGKIDPQKFATEFDSMVRAIVASEGLLKPRDFLQTIQQGGPAIRAMNADEFWGFMPAAMNAMGSSKSGTAVMSLFQQMVGHVVAGKRVAEAMQAAGFLKPGSWKVERGGHVVMAPDALVDQKDFQTNPFTWLHAHLQQLHQMKGGDDIIQQIFQLSSRQTTARLLSDIDANWPVFQNEFHRQQRVPNVEQLNKIQNEADLSKNIANFQAAWDNLMTALGAQGVPVAINFLHTLTDGITLLTQAALAHPEAAKALLELAAGLSAITVIGGTVMVVAAGLSGVATAFRVLSGAVVGIASTVTTIAAGFAELGKWLSPLGAFFGILLHSNPANKNERQDLQEEMRKQGWEQGADGKWHRAGEATVQKQSFVAPSGGSPHITNVTMTLDKQKIGNILFAYMGNKVGNADPLTGNTRDGSAIPIFPGHNYTVTA